MNWLAVAVFAAETGEHLLEEPHNRRFERFQRRGRAAARSEWRLIAATHNLLKLHSHRLAAAGV